MTKVVTKTQDTIFDLFEDKTDHDAFENGRWFTLNPTSRIKLRSALSSKAASVRKDLDRPYALRVESGIKLTVDEYQEIYLQLLCQAVIVDWEGPIFVHDNGKPMKCTPKNAHVLLSDPRLVKFLAFLTEAVMKSDNFDAVLDAASEKN